MSTLNLQVGASADDADESVTTGEMALTGTQITFGSTNITRHVGIRFTGVTGLSGVIIDSAILTFLPAITDFADFVGDWFADDAAAPGTFTTTAFDISDRTRTTATQEGDGSDFGFWTGGVNVTFEGDAGGIKGIVQELADSYDPSAIALLHIFTSGSGERIARPFDHATITAPKLDLTFTPPPEPPAPTGPPGSGIGTATAVGLVAQGAHTGLGEPHYIAQVILDLVQGVAGNEPPPQSFELTLARVLAEVNDAALPGIGYSSDRLIDELSAFMLITRDRRKPLTGQLIDIMEAL